MSNEADATTRTKVYTTADGHAVIEQAQGSVVLSAEEILHVIQDLRACYDYCAAWKDATQDTTTP